jgi:hypothetical protein
MNDYAVMLQQEDQKWLILWNGVKSG